MQSRSGLAAHGAFARTVASGHCLRAVRAFPRTGWRADSAPSISSGWMGRVDATCVQRGRVPGKTAKSQNGIADVRSDEHTSELQAQTRNSYAVYAVNNNTTQLYDQNVIHQRQA